MNLKNLYYQQDYNFVLKPWLKFAALLISSQHYQRSEIVDLSQLHNDIAQ